MREIYNIYDICDHGSPYRVKTNLIMLMLNVDREFSDFFCSTWHPSLSLIHEEKLILASPSKHSIHSFFMEKFLGLAHLYSIYKGTIHLRRRCQRPEVRFFLAFLVFLEKLTEWRALPKAVKWTTTICLPALDFDFFHLKTKRLWSHISVWNFLWIYHKNFISMMVENKTSHCYFCFI